MSKVSGTGVLKACVRQSLPDSCSSRIVSVQGVLTPLLRYPRLESRLRGVSNMDLSEEKQEIALEPEKVLDG